MRDETSDESYQLILSNRMLCHQSLTAFPAKDILSISRILKMRITWTDALPVGMRI